MQGLQSSRSLINSAGFKEFYWISTDWKEQQLEKNGFKVLGKEYVCIKQL